MNIEWDEEGMRAVLREAAETIAGYDAAFRATHEGYPVEVVEADVEGAFPGVELPAGMKHEYAMAVSEGKPFRIELTG